MKPSLLTAATLLLLSACSSQEKQIEKVAYAYNYALATYNIEAAMPYATQETQESTLQMAKKIIAMVDSNYLKADSPATIEITNIKMVNDSLAIATYHKTTPLKDMELTTELRRRNGKWLAHEVLPQPKARPITPPAVAEEDTIKTFTLR